MNTQVGKKDKESAEARSAARAAALQAETDLDATLEASFPASDPPSWTLGASKTVATTTGHEVAAGNDGFGGPQYPPSKSCGDRQGDKRGKSACVEFPAWINEEPLCRVSPKIAVFGSPVILPIFPT